MARLRTFIGVDIGKGMRDPAEDKKMDRREENIGLPPARHRTWDHGSGIGQRTGRQCEPPLTTIPQRRLDDVCVRAWRVPESEWANAGSPSI